MLTANAGVVESSLLFQIRDSLSGTIYFQEKSMLLPECYRYPYLRRVNDCFVVVVVVAENDDDFGGGGAFDCSWRVAGESGDSNPMAPVLLPVSYEFAPAQSFACEFGVGA
jgi:hypothetical protein